MQDSEANMEKVVVVDGTNKNLSSSLISSCLPHDNNINQVKPYDIEKLKQCPDSSIDPLHLVLGKFIDRGSYSVVHKGSYHGQTVAVKVMDFTNEVMERKKNYFIREVGIWQNLDHPNITKMIGQTMSMKSISSARRVNNITKIKSDYCIVSEYIRGGTLASYLFTKRHKKLPMKTVVRFALDLAKGLSYLHSKKIVHRDVKPENILIDKQHYILKLADFGESNFEEDIFWEGKETGTRHYTAPEVVRKFKYGHKCDVYTFGICLWEIYCCERAHKHGFADKLTPELYDITKPSRPLNCPIWLTRLMENCWDSDPRKRPEMKEVIVQLEEVVKSEGWQTMPEDQQGGFGCFGSFMHGR